MRMVVKVGKLYFSTSFFWWLYGNVFMAIALFVLVVNTEKTENECIGEYEFWGCQSSTKKCHRLCENRGIDHSTLNCKKDCVQACVCEARYLRNSSGECVYETECLGLVNFKQNASTVLMNSNSLDTEELVDLPTEEELNASNKKQPSSSVERENSDLFDSTEPTISLLDITGPTKLYDKFEQIPTGRPTPSSDEIELVKPIDTNNDKKKSTTKKQQKSPTSKPTKAKSRSKKFAENEDYEDFDY